MELTPEIYRCHECKHRGPAMMYPTYDVVPYGDQLVQTDWYEPLCEKCGSSRIDLVRDD